jgi:hypothetical protein
MPTIAPRTDDREAASLHDKLEYVVAPLFHGRPLAFAGVMRSAIALNGSYYTAQRMVTQYLCNAYAARPPRGAADPAGGDGPDVAAVASGRVVEG